MPDRPTHRNLSICAGVIAAPVTLVLLPLDYAAAFELGVGLTLLAELTPDLDISTRRFSWLGEFIGLKAYAKLIAHRYGTRKKDWQNAFGQEKKKPIWLFNPKHWSRLKIWHIFLFSHIPFIGTLLRTLLCTLPLLVALMLFGITSEKFWSQLGWYWLWLWLGMSWSDCWHVGADLIVSDFKETKREFWYGKQKEQRLFYRKTNRL